jgi:H+-translocating NAD(P) transhydrogenase subunit alpha
MEVAVLRERRPGEKRVALTPDLVLRLAEAGWKIRVEAGAGEGAGWPDGEFRKAGALIESEPGPLLDGVRLVLKVRPPLYGPDASTDEVATLPRGVILASLLSPGEHPGLLQAMADRGISAMALERMPRITRAQSMDVLSSQATAAGYQAVLMAASRLPRFFPMLTTAAGTIRPAKVLVLGAGVAGLQAIATARRLGASVQGYDIRAAAGEQVRSLGATFLEEVVPEDAETEGGYARELEESEKDRQLRFLDEHIPAVDVVISTAQIPGRPAPLLITRTAVEGMKGGSVVVDLAGESGGNCELSRPGEEVVHGGVTILAPLDLPSGMAQHASEMFARNLRALLDHLAEADESGEKALTLDPDDEIVGAILVTHDGALRVPGQGS